MQNYRNHILFLCVTFFTLNSQVQSSTRAQKMCLAAEAELAKQHAAAGQEQVIAGPVTRKKARALELRNQALHAAATKQQQLEATQRAITGSRDIMATIHSFLLPAEQAQLATAARDFRDQNRTIRDNAALIRSTAFKPMHRAAPHISLSKAAAAALDQACWSLGMPASTREPIAVSMQLATAAKDLLRQKNRLNQISKKAYFSALHEIHYLHNWAHIIIDHSSARYFVSRVNQAPLLQAIADAQPGGATPGSLNLRGLLDAYLEAEGPLPNHDEFFGLILKQVPHITHLDASHNPTFFSKGQVHFIHSKLQSLNISHNNMVPLHQFTLPALKHLDYSHNDDFAQDLCFYGLETLNISHLNPPFVLATRATDFLCLFPCKTIIADGSSWIIDRIMNHAISLPKLRTLSVHGASEQQQVRVTSAQFKALAPRLVELDLGD